MTNRIALVSLPRQDLLRPPAAIPILAAACEEYNCDYDFFDFNLWLNQQVSPDTWNSIDDNWFKLNSRFDESLPWVVEFRQQLTRFVDQLLEYQPSMIAVSIFTDMSAHCAYELISELNSRAERKNFKIVIGGTGVTARLWLSEDPICKWMLDTALIDCYIYGEGEINFRKVLDNDWSGAGINNMEFHQIDDLDQFPLPSYQKVHPNKYQYIGYPTVTLNGSRGCVRACTYCNVAKYWPKFRYKKGEKIANELYHTWQSTGVRSFEFSDSLINGSIKEFRAMNQQLIALQQQDPNFSVEYKGQFICRDSQQFKEKDYAEMKQAGCNYIYVGVETFSDRVRYSMDKKFDNQALDFHLKMCAKYAIPNVFLMFVGYPTETAEDHEANINGLYQYQRYSQAGVIDLITWGFTGAILEDTPLFHQQDALAIVPEFDDFVNKHNWISLKNPELTYRERVRRWLELTELSAKLGYNQPRIDAIIQRLSQILIDTKHRSKYIPIITK